MSWWDESTPQTKVMLFVVAVITGYILTSVYFAFRSGEERDVEGETIVDVSPEEVLEQSAGGVDLPPEVRARMLGETPSAGPTNAVSAPPNYTFLIAERGFEQVMELKKYRETPEGQKQEDGVTQADLDAMAREGRMAW